MALALAISRSLPLAVTVTVTVTVPLAVTVAVTVTVPLAVTIALVPPPLSTAPLVLAAALRLRVTARVTSASGAAIVATGRRAIAIAPFLFALAARPAAAVPPLLVRAVVEVGVELVVLVDPAPRDD